MTTENSSLVFGIRTREAVTSLEMLQRELVKTYDTVDALAAKQIASGATSVGANRDVVASARAVTDAIEKQEGAAASMARTSASYRQKVGEASASFKAGLRTSAADLRAFQKEVQAAALDPNTALGLARIQGTVDMAKKRIAELNKLSVTQARSSLQAIEQAESEVRTRQMADLKADIIARSKLADQQSAQARAALVAGERAQAAVRANELAALRADIIARSKLETTTAAQRAKQAAASLAAQQAAETAARASQLAALRADITERNKLAQAAAARHADTRRKQAELAIKYDEMELASRIRVLRRMDELQSRGYSSSTLARRYGVNALGDVKNLAQFQEQLRVMRETERAEKALEAARRRSADAGRDAGSVLGNNTKAMREAHSAARGLAGSLGSLWMTYGALAPLLAGAAIGGIARSTFTVGKDVEYRLQMLQALGNAAASVNDLMPAVHGSMKTPLEAAEGLQQLAQAGLATHEALTVLAPTLQLATLGEMSVADAALTTTAALSTFNLQMHEAIRVGDVFAKGASISNASVSDIAEAMKQAGSGAAAYGLTLEETVAQVTALAQAGIRGTAAGTAVKNSMKELYAPTNKAAKIMKQIGLETYDSEGKARNFLDILRDLKAVTAEMTDEHQNAMLGGMFNERSRRAIQIFLNDMGRLEDMAKGLNDPDGYLAKANERLLDTVEGASNRFQSVLEQSYVKAFDALRPQIRETIDALEGFVGSDGFVAGVQNIGSAFSAITSAVTGNIGVLTTLAAVYGTLKVAQLAFGAASAVNLNWTRATTAAVVAKNAAMGTLTATTAASTASAQLNNLAQATLAGTISRTQAVASAAAIAFRGLTAAMGVIGAVVAVASLAMGSFASSTAPAVTESDRLRRSTDAVTSSIRAEIAAIQERRRQRALDSGITIESDAKAMAARQEQIEKLGQDAEAAKARADQSSAKALEAALSTPRSAAQVVIQANKDREELDRIQAELVKAKADLDEDTSVRAQGVIERQKAQLEGRLESLKREAEYERDTILRSKEDSNTRPFLGEVENTIATIDRAMNLAGSSAGVAKDYVDGLNDSWGKLRGNIDDKRTLIVDPGGGDGGGGGGNLEFRSSSSNLQAELRNQKQLLSGMRDFRLKILEDEAKQGVWTSQQAADQRKQIWDQYQDAYAAKAAETSFKIQALDKGSAALKDLTSQKIQEEVEQERRLANQSQLIQLEKERYESLSRARSMASTTAIDLESVRRQIQLDEISRLDELAKRYLPADQLAALEARNKTEEAFNKLLEDRMKMLQAGVQNNPDFVNTEEGKALQRSIALIEQEKAVAVSAAGAIAQSNYTDTQTIFGGYQSALKELADQAITTGDTVAESLSGAFKAVGNLAGELVTTGRVNVRSFFSELAAQTAKMYANQFMMQLLGAFMPSFGGVAGSGVTSYGLRVPGVASAMGNVFSAGTVKKFAKGGAFTNSLATGPTLAPMALFGEAGPEAIMPLTRTAGGELGVRAVPTGAPASMGAPIVHIETNVHVQSDGTATSQTDVSGRAEGMAAELSREIEAVATGVVRRQLSQGGMIRSAIDKRN